MFQSASSSLAGDSEAQKRLVSNVAGSLSSLYASANGNTALLDSVKAQALSFLNASSSTEITDAGDATQAVSSLNALVTLPGAMSAAQTASAVSMFGRFAASSFSLLASGAATVDFAVEVAPILVSGSLNVFQKTILPSSSRRILAYKTGMDAAYSAIVSAAKVQAFALAASQDAVVTEYAPIVEGVRRLRSVSALAAIIPPSSLFGIAVSVAPDVDASSVVDVGVAVVVQATSPFQDAGSAVLISPIVAVASFNAATGAPISSTRNIVEAKFPVSQSSHDARVVANAAGQRKGEGCVRVLCYLFSCMQLLTLCIQVCGSRWNALVALLCNCCLLVLQPLSHMRLQRHSCDTCYCRSGVRRGLQWSFRRIACVRCLQDLRWLNQRHFGVLSFGKCQRRSYWRHCRWMFSNQHRSFCLLAPKKKSPNFRI